VTLVVLRRLRYRLTLRDLCEMFLLRGIVFSHETVAVLQNGQPNRVPTMLRDQTVRLTEVSSSRTRDATVRAAALVLRRTRRQGVRFGHGHWPSAAEKRRCPTISDCRRRRVLHVEVHARRAAINAP
jgi:hypothetical protein